jgi:hypothetical protein
MKIEGVVSKPASKAVTRHAVGQDQRILSFVFPFLVVAHRSAVNSGVRRLPVFRKKKPMKRCSQCNQTYTADDLNFCLSDGTPLTVESEEKTLVMPETTVVRQSAFAPKKSKFLLWLGLIGFVVLVGSGLLVGLLIYHYSGQGESVRAERHDGVSLPPSPTLAPTLTVTPTPAAATSSPVEESSPKNEESKPTPNQEDTEDITPIAWSTTAAGFKGEGGQTYTFQCPKGGAAQAVYGSDAYTDFSSICTAAVHAGIFSLADGGKVTVEYRAGRSIYGSTLRNDITSNTSGENARSFVVR